MEAGDEVEEFNLGEVKRVKAANARVKCGSHQVSACFGQTRRRCTRAW